MKEYIRSTDRIVKKYERIQEPYVGMPIYLDDSFFSQFGNGPQYPLGNNEDMINIDIDEDMESMPGQCLPGQCPMPNQGTTPTTPGTMPTAPTMPGTIPTTPTMPGTMPTAPTMPGTMPSPTMPGTVPTAPTMPGTMPTAPTMPGTMPSPITPQRSMNNKYMPDRGRPDWCMPDQVMGDYTETKPGYILNDCAAGCPLAMAYVPWQSWENTYEDEVAFKVGTVFPSLDLPFLGGKRK